MRGGTSVDLVVGLRPLDFARSLPRKTWLPHPGRQHIDAVALVDSEIFSRRFVEGIVSPIFVVEDYFELFLHHLGHAYQRLTYIHDVEFDLANHFVLELQLWGPLTQGFYQMP